MSIQISGYSQTKNPSYFAASVMYIVQMRLLESLQHPSIYAPMIFAEIN